MHLSDGGLYLGQVNGMLSIWDASCLGFMLFGMLSIWDVQYLGCSAFRMLIVWDAQHSGCTLAVAADGDYWLGNGIALLREHQHLICRQQRRCLLCKAQHKILEQGRN